MTYLLGFNLYGASSIFRPSLTLLALLAQATVSYSQESRASVTGRIDDPSGSIVAV